VIQLDFPAVYCRPGVFDSLQISQRSDRALPPISAVVPVRDADWPINILPAVTPFSANAPVPYRQPGQHQRREVLDLTWLPPPVDFALASIILRVGGVYS